MKEIYTHHCARNTASMPIRIAPQMILAFKRTAVPHANLAPIAVTRERPPTFSAPAFSNLSKLSKGSDT
jgi:hypothetical protein